ncbi:hypothetical protein Emag_007513 [Eimeria magna]
METPPGDAVAAAAAAVAPAVAAAAAAALGVCSKREVIVVGETLLLGPLSSPTANQPLCIHIWIDPDISEGAAADLRQCLASEQQQQAASSCSKQQQATPAAATRHIIKQQHAAAAAAAAAAARIIRLLMKGE